MIKLIVAIDLNGAIGFKNKLLFHCPEDMKRFKEFTTGHIVLMGRSTYESLPVDKLPNRVNVVLTKNTGYKPENPKVCVEHDLNGILNYYNSTGTQDKDVWVIGGSSIYKQLIPYVDEFHITVFQAKAEKADSYFPIEDVLNDEAVSLSSSETFYSENIDSDVSFLVYKRNKENQ